MRDERLEVSVSFDERRGYVAKSACRAPGRSPVLLRGGGPPSFAGGEPMPDLISRLQLVRDEVDKAFGAGFAGKHPELVIANPTAATAAASALVMARGRPCCVQAQAARRTRASRGFASLPLPKSRLPPK
jgi:hypothetical protein